MRSALAALVLLLALPAAGQAPSAPSGPGEAAASRPGAETVRSELEKARELVRSGRLEEALAILRPLSASGAGGESVRFALGLAALEAAQRRGVAEDRRDSLLDEAIAAFRGMLVRSPGLVRVRLELGRAFFLKGEDILARRHFERVLAGRPPAAVALNVHRFLAQMRARKRWSVRVGVALAPDSNIGATSEERTIYIGGLPFRRDREELTSSGIGVSAWLGGEYQYPLGDSGAGAGPSRWRLRAGGDISRREYRAREFDRMTLSAYLGPRWLIGRASEASLLASARQGWQADEQEYRDLGFRAEARHRLSLRTRASLDATWHQRRYERRTHLDGAVTDISAGIGWVVTPTVRLNGAAGWGRVGAELERERHSRRWVRLGANFALPYGFTAGGSATLRWTDYEGDWLFFTPDGESRSDLTRNFRVDVHNRGLTVGGFSPQISAVHERRTTNAQIYDYKRTFGELRFVRLF